MNNVNMTASSNSVLPVKMRGMPSCLLANDVSGQYSGVYSVTNWVNISPMEYYLTSVNIDPTCKWEEINSCSLCMCPLFDTIEDENGPDLMKSIIETQNKLHENIVSGSLKDYEVVGLPHCKGIHLFHKECLLNQFNSAKQEFIKCAVCESTYGVRTGDMPHGIMKWK